MGAGGVGPARPHHLYSRYMGRIFRSTLTDMEVKYHALPEGRRRSHAWLFALLAGIVVGAIATQMCAPQYFAIPNKLCSGLSLVEKALPSGKSNRRALR